MTARRCIGYALIAGLTRGEALTMEPGEIMDIYGQRQAYDDDMHGIRRKHTGRWEEA